MADTLTEPDTLTWVIEAKVEGYGRAVITPTDTLTHARALARWIPREAVLEWLRRGAEQVREDATVTLNVLPFCNSMLYAPVSSYEHAVGQSKPVAWNFEECDDFGRDPYPRLDEIEELAEGFRHAEFGDLAMSQDEGKAYLSGAREVGYEVHIEVWHPEESMPYGEIDLLAKHDPTDEFAARALEAYVIANAAEVADELTECRTFLGDEIGVRVNETEFDHGRKTVTAHVTPVTVRTVPREIEERA